MHITVVMCGDVENLLHNPAKASFLDDQQFLRDTLHGSPDLHILCIHLRNQAPGFNQSPAMKRPIPQLAPASSGFNDDNIESV